MMNSLSLLKTSSSGNGSSGCRLDCLPYDILISILQSPVLDLHSTMLFAEIWPHYNQLVMHVLQYYHLPRLCLQSAMDQEGKRRYHSWFHFHSLDVINRRVTFMVQPTTTSGAIAKRYISNTYTAARPHLRHITLHHTYHHYSPPPSSSSADHHLFLGEKACSASSSSCSLSLVQCPEIINTTNKSSSSSSDLLHDSNTMGTNMIQSHPLSLKHGLHTLSTRSCRQKRKKQGQRFSATMMTPLPSNSSNSNNNKETWQFSYRVSYTNDPTTTQQQQQQQDEDDKSRKSQQKLKTEHMYVSPISLTVSLSTLRTSSCSLFEQPSTNNTKSSSSSSSCSWFEKYIKPKLSFL